MGEHILPVFQLAGSPPYRRRPAGAFGGNCGGQRMVERGTWPRPHVSSPLRQTLRPAPTAPRTWATTTSPPLMPSATQDRRRFLPQQMLVDHEVDHAGQPRISLPARHAHRVRGALSVVTLNSPSPKDMRCARSDKDRPSSSAADAPFTKRCRQRQYARQPNGVERRLSSICLRLTVSCWLKCSPIRQASLFAEQNNGYLLQNFFKAIYRSGDQVDPQALGRVAAINTLDANGRPQFIHSATYEELIAAFGMTPEAIANAVENEIARRSGRERGNP